MSKHCWKTTGTSTGEEKMQVFKCGATIKLTSLMQVIYIYLRMVHSVCRNGGAGGVGVSYLTDHLPSPCVGGRAGT